MQLCIAMLVLMAVFPMASVTAGEGSCRYYVKIFEAKEMDCFLTRDGNDPVCTVSRSSKHCSIGAQPPQLCIKWPVITSITCRNSTHRKEMEDTEKDCAADQKSLDCSKEFSSDTGEHKGDKNLAHGINAGWHVVLCVLIIGGISTWIPVL